MSIIGVPTPISIYEECVKYSSSFSVASVAIIAFLREGVKTERSGSPHRLGHRMRSVAWPV